LCDEVPFFKAAFTKEFKEASEGALHLPEDDVDTFERFLQWIYSGEYNLSGLETETEADERYLQLAMLYILADKLQVPRLKNNVIDKLFEMKAKANRVPQRTAVSYVFKSSMGNSQLRKFMVDWYAWHINFKYYNEAAKEFLYQCPEFAADLAITLAQRVANPHNAGGLLAGKEQDYYEKVEDL